MEPDDTTLTEIKNGWHCGSRALNLTVRGDTPEQAKQRFLAAVEKAKEIRMRPQPRFANLS